MRISILLWLLFHYIQQGSAQQIDAIQVFYSLPKEYLMCEDEFHDAPSRRQNMIKKSNKNYLKAKHEGMRIDMKLYTRISDSSTIIAYNRECGLNCPCLFNYIFEYNVTKKKMTATNALNQEEYTMAIKKFETQERNMSLQSFIIGQMTNTIIIKDLISKKNMFELIWNGEKFEIMEIK